MQIVGKSGVGQGHDLDQGQGHALGHLAGETATTRQTVEPGKVIGMIWGKDFEGE